MTEKKKPSLVGGAAAATVGSLMATQAPSKLLGYHNVLHGTSNLNAAKIKRRGFQPSKGGTGASKHTPDAKTFVTASKGKIHVTTLKDVARDFAGLAQRNGKGKILKAKISDRHWRNMKADEFGANGMKDISATTHHKIPAHQVKGGKGYRGVRGVVNRNTLRAYYRSAAGRSRAASGLIALTAGAAGNAYLAHAVKSRMEKKASLIDLARGKLEGL
jgi:hypothetical protein